MNRTILALGTASILLAAADAGADAVRLRAAVRLASDAAAVRLGDVAQLDGPEAERFADLVLAPAPHGEAPLELDVLSIRRALGEAGVRWSLVDLSGRRVVVRGRPSISRAAPAANGEIAIVGADAPEDEADGGERTDDTVDASRLVGERTLRGLVARTIAAGLAVEPQDLRLVLRRGDAEWLALAGDDRDFRLERDSGFLGPRVAFRTARMQDGRIAEERTIVVRPLVRTIAHVPVQTVEHGAPIDPDALVAEESWIAPLHAAALATEPPAGDAVAARTLRAGSPIRARDLEAACVVARGDVVTVQCVVGSIEITFEAEALDAGAVGDVVAVRKPGERERLQAVVLGPGSVAIESGRAARQERSS